MEEEILDMIGEYVPEGQKESYCLCAKEIDTLTHDHYMRFVEWYFRIGQFKYRFMSEESAYQYWLDNIEKK